MKMSVAQFQAALKEQEPELRIVTLPATGDHDAAFFQKVAAALLTQAADLLDEGRLGYASYALGGEPAAEFSVELSPVNLPMADYKKVNQFFTDETAPVALNLYLVTRAEHLNVSHFHIDLLGSSEADLTSYQESAAMIMAANWTKIVANFQNPPAPKTPTPIVKTTTKKAATSKKTTKKASAKKTTTKKTGAKKATTKRAATKKTATKTTAVKKATTKKAAPKAAVKKTGATKKITGKQATTKTTK
ncbi:hypothetical protein [Lapidilactobacillus luobeiensis]|uniref:hypothetical protein n=1 Tax=Lapidilactobacillus luobeiensis TaxID=2950371 RepID=UPI0021C44FD1|nr:hypothetical protein [Lapidilactobacillus luobeiensis]